MNKIILVFGSLLTAFMSFGQQDAQYTNYMYNTVSVNPAYAGTRQSLSVFGLHRSQWVGLEGAPTTNHFSINSPVSNSVGLGLSFVNDNIGPANENTISVDFAYAVPLGKKYILSMGLKGTANLFNVDYSKMNIYTADVLANNMDNEFTPNIGTGFYIYSDKSYIGLSVPNLLETQRFDAGTISVDSNVSSERLHYFLIAGHVFDLSSNVKLKPSLLTKVVTGAPLQVDLSANVLLYDKLTLGLAYRWDAAISALAGFQISKSLMIGYGYDMEVTDLNAYNGGSHEIFLRFDLTRKISRIVQPRFF